MILEFFEEPEHPEIHITAINEQVEIPEGCLPGNENLYKYAMAMQLLLSDCDAEQPFEITAETLRFLMSSLSQAAVSSEEEIRRTSMSPADTDVVSRMKSKNGRLESFLLHAITDVAAAGHYEQLGNSVYAGGLKLAPTGQRSAKIAFMEL